MERIVVVDDDASICRSLEVHLGQAGYEVHSSTTAAGGLELIERHDPAVVFLDLRLPDRSGLEVLRQIEKGSGSRAVIMISGEQDMGATIEAIRSGALDYIRKPLDLDDLLISIEKAKRHLHAPAPQTAAVAVGDTPCSPREIVGRDKKIVEVVKQIGLVSKSRVTVLVEGESGTGKELVARAIHQASCPQAPFVAINCSALVPTLIESELFGHERGAFTGAEHRKIGKLEAAGEGTVFLDEISELSLELQAKLLRALQEREFERVGGSQVIALRARVIAATNRHPEALAEAGLLRRDLLFRLSVARIVVPPLRERRQDIPLLVRYLLARIDHALDRKVEGVSQGALRKLQAYDWPGNVRELENVLTRAVVLTRGDMIEEEAIELAPKGGEPGAGGSKAIKTLREVERDHVESVLFHSGWNITRAAALLGISPTTLRKKIKDFGIEDPRE